jgi:hypothetical protein
MKPILWLPVLGGPLAVAGAVAFGVADGAKAALSFLGGLALALAIVALGVVLVDMATRISPNFGMLIAFSNYLLTVLFFVLLLKVVDPDSVDVPAFATGLATSVVPYLAWQFAQARPT